MLNKQVKRILSKNNIGDEGVMYLLAVFHELNLPIISNAIKSRVNSLGIISKDVTTKMVNWHIPLYEGQQISNSWAWVQDWINLFKQINPTRAGVKRSVTARMKTFFSENPEVRAHEVMEATKLYLGGVQGANFVKTSHKFIYEGNGSSKVSMLASYIEIYRKKNSRLKNNNLMK